MKLIDADILKENYKNKIKLNLIDTSKGIDFLKYADTVCKDFNKFIDEQPTVDVLDTLRTEILEYIDDLDIAYEICGVFDKYKVKSENKE